MKTIDIHDFEKNLDYYLELSNEEDILVTDGNKELTVLTSPSKIGLANLLSCYGIMAKYDDGRDYREVLTDELVKKHLS